MLGSSKVISPPLQAILLVVEEAQVEERIIQEALTRAGGSQSKAAKILGITRQTLNRRLLTKKRTKTD